jgi:membrane protein implicated in regulation of membrane protease activity
LSVVEDITAVGLLWLVLTHPLVALALVAVLVVLAAWLLPKLVRFVGRVLKTVLGGAPEGTR